MTVALTVGGGRFYSIFTFSSWDKRCKSLFGFLYYYPILICYKYSFGNYRNVDNCEENSLGVKCVQNMGGDSQKKKSGLH